MSLFFLFFCFRLLLLVLVAMLPAMGVIIYSGLEQYRLAEVKARQEATTVAEHICERFEHTILATRQLLHTLSQIPAVRRGNGGSGSALFKELVKTLIAYTPKLGYNISK